MNRVVQDRLFTVVVRRREFRMGAVAQVQGPVAHKRKGERGTLLKDTLLESALIVPMFSPEE